MRTLFGISHVHQLEPGVLRVGCACVYTLNPLKYMCNSRKDLNLNSNHRNVNNNAFVLK